MTPDVSVIIAVHNTAYMLPTTFDSLRRQTLGPERVQVVLIDDGSTDDSGRLTDEFAASYPGPVEVRHQKNSGTPAVPFNRGLDLATGRYVFFLGSDDYLWAEALERLVAAADRWESDVVFGPVVGVDGHKVAQRVYRHGTTEDLDVYTSDLPYALANTKLFRRSLIESLGLRYREDMRQRCDQPFTLTAIVKGRRTSLLTDGEYYFATGRPDRSNVTYTADHNESLRSTEIVMDTIAELIEAGPRRDHVMRRQFDVTLDRELAPHFLSAAPEVREVVLERVGALADRYLTEGLLESLAVDTRIRIIGAQHRDDEAVCAAIVAFAAADQGLAIPLAIHGEDVVLQMPARARRGLPEATFRTRQRLKKRVAQTITTVDTVWRGRHELSIDLAVQITGLTPDLVSAVLEPVDTTARPIRSRRLAGNPFKERGFPTPVAVREQDGVTRCTMVLDPRTVAPRTIHTPRLRLAVGGFQYDFPVQALNGPPVDHVGGRWWSRHVLTVGADATGNMFVERRAITDSAPPVERGE